jgi:hypothetical protein
MISKYQARITGQDLLKPQNLKAHNDLSSFKILKIFCNLDNSK